MRVPHCLGGQLGGQHTSSKQSQLTAVQVLSTSSQLLELLSSSPGTMTRSSTRNPRRLLLVLLVQHVVLQAHGAPPNLVFFMAVRNSCSYARTFHQTRSSNGSTPSHLLLLPPPPPPPPPPPLMLLSGRPRVRRSVVFRWASDEPDAVGVPFVFARS